MFAYLPHVAELHQIGQQPVAGAAPVEGAVEPEIIKKEKKAEDEDDEKKK
jgi:hypothetical protein